MNRPFATHRLVAALITAGVAASSNAAELGRLFFDPSQRVELEKRRFAPPPAAALTPSAPAAATPVPEPLGQAVVNGRVSRSSGRSTTWINGTPEHDQIRSTDPTRVVLPAGQRARVPVKIGQTLDRDTRAVTDELNGGRINVDRRR